MIKRLILMAFALCLCSGGIMPAEPAGGTDNKKTEMEVLRLDGERFQAMIKRDIGSLGAILSEELSYGTSDGRLLSKADFMSAIKAGKLEYRSIAPKETRARVYGDTCLVDGTAEMAVGPETSGFTVKVRYLAIYILKEGSWVMVAWQSAELPPR